MCIKARGIIKPDKERLSVSSMNSGKVISSAIKNNKEVKKGDTLITLNNSIVSEQLKLSDRKIEDSQQFIEDLTYLIDNKAINFQEIKTPKYQKEYLLFKQNKEELEVKFKKTRQDYLRKRKLYKKGVIAKVEFENIRLEYNLLKSNIKQLIKRQNNLWQTQLTEQENLLNDLVSENKRLTENNKQLVVIAPINGTLINVTTLEIGSYLASGVAFTEISPNTDLIVECLISPADIGFLKKSNPVIYQLDSYNYNQWGTANGQIIDIGKDIEFSQNTSAFRVQSSIYQKNLKLKNGFQGKIKKGMTLNAQFKLAKRSLFDLLYDKVDDWLNPSQNNETALTNL